jgi:nitrous oxidase accessory protein
VERTIVRGIREKSAGEKGSGIHVWNTSHFTLLENDIADVRDGVYIQSSPFGTIRGNVAKDLRYGLHYMYSDDNVFEDNLFENGAAGTAVMYSRRLTFRRNRFLRNRGFASVGLLLKTCDDVLAEYNLIADNARGIFLEGSARTVIRENVIAGSDVALVIYDSATETRVSGNSFVGNLTPLELSGRRTDTLFDGNYWSDNEALDLDGDGRTDRPYRLAGLFDHLRGNLTAADLMSRSLGAALVAAAERALPVLDPVPVFDRAPLVRSPRLPVPAAARETGAAGRAPIGLLLSMCMLGTAACALHAVRHSPPRSRAQ